MGVSVMGKAWAEETVIVALGDSTTAGTPGFRSPLEYPPDGAGDVESQYVYWMNQKHPEWKIYNRGVNGERTDQIFKRFDRDVLALKPEIVIVLAGVNDLFQGFSVEGIRMNLRAIYQHAVQANIKVVACTILPFNISTPEVKARMQEVNEWIRAYAGEQGLEFCDLYAAVNDPKRPGNLIGSDDDVHPDVEGYKKIGFALAECLERQQDQPHRS